VKVKAKLFSTLKRRNYRAALAHVLLLIVAYGALVGTVHNHGQVRPGKVNLVAAFTDGSESRAAEDGKSIHRECSMCQLQRQLFDGFVHATPFARTSLSEIVFVPAQTVSYHPTSITPRLGRAPPLA
jgi:hypothetical protein